MDFVWIFLAAFIGSILTSIMYHIRVDGVLRIDRSNPEKDIYRFDVGDLDKLSKHKYITLKVDSNADLSQK